MATHSNVPSAMLESIRDNLDRRIKLSIKRMVTMKVREKWEQRVLAFSTCRLYIFLARTPTKMEQNFSYLDIQSIESKKQNQLVLTVEGKSPDKKTTTFTFATMESNTEEVNHMITHIGTALKTVFPSSPFEKLIKKIEVQPPDRIKPMYDLMKTIEVKETGPCGGFTMMYACMCDYHDLPYRDEVAWDVDTIYLSQDSRQLCLRDFDHLNGRDLMPIISALLHNSWFTTLNANNVKLTPDVCAEILRVMKKNTVIEELLLSNTGINVDFVTKLSTTLLSASGTQLSQLDLSGNALDDKALVHLMGSLSSRGKGVTYLDLSRTKLTKGLNKVADAMGKGSAVFSSLQVLKLAELSAGKDDLQPLYNFLAQPNMLTHLDLSNTDCELDRMAPALQRSCSQTLVWLKLSRTSFTNRKTKEIVVQDSFKQFFATACCLQYLNLSSVKMPPEAVKDLLLGVGSNKNIIGLHLDISRIDLQNQGAQNLQNCLSSVTNISCLNISNIGFQDQDLCSVLNSIGRNKAIKHLAVGCAFHQIRAKNLNSVLEELVHLIQDEESVLESLSLADSKLKSSMNIIINALGSNTSLTEIDISGNQMGDLGARMLSKALQINNKLKTIMWDKNNTSAQGFEDIADALEKNYTLKKMPMPVYDASVALREQPERTETALQTIERLLQRNHSPRKYSSDQAYRLQQGFLISSTQQMVDRLVVQVQDTINALSVDPVDEYADDIETAKMLIKDADNSKTLLPKLHDLANNSQNPGNAVEQQLIQVASDLKTVLETQIKKTVSDMVSCTASQCDVLMTDRSFRSDLELGCSQKSAFPKDFTSNILDGVDTDIFNKLSELNLAVAAHVSDRVMDEVIELLSQSHKTLTNHLNVKKKNMRSSTLSQKIDMDNGSPQLRKSAPSPQESPKVTSKRKSMHARKLRPQSVVDREHVQVALATHEARGKALPTLPASPNKSPVLGSRSDSPVPKIEVTYANIADEKTKSDDLDKKESGGGGRSKHSVVVEDDTSEEFDQVPELASGPKLDHATKNRPRPRRSQQTRPSRPTPRTSSLQDNFNPDSGTDAFFSSPTTRPSVTPPAGNKADEKPKKEERNLFKNKKSGSGKTDTKSASVNESSENVSKSVNNSSVKQEKPVVVTPVAEQEATDKVKAESPPETKKDIPSMQEPAVQKKIPLRSPSSKSNEIKDEKKPEEETASKDNEEAAETKAETSVADDKSDVGSPAEEVAVEKPEEGQKEEEKEEEEEEKKEEVKKQQEEVTPPPPAVRKPMGMGFGVNLMAEMKKKQENRMSMAQNIGKRSSDKTPSPKSEPKEAPMFGIQNLRSPRNSGNKGKTDDTSGASEPVKPAEKPAEPVQPSKVLPSSENSKRLSGGGEGEISTESTETSGGGAKPVPTPRPSAKPVPPSRPKKAGPPTSTKPKPMPRSNRISETDDLAKVLRRSIAVDGDEKFAASKDPEKMSVREKAAQLAEEKNKSGSLPRSSSPSAMKKENTPSKRPHSMFDLLNSKPDLKKSPLIKEKEEKESAKDSNDNDKSTADEAQADGVTPPKPDSSAEEILV